MSCYCDGFDSNGGFVNLFPSNLENEGKITIDKRVVYEQEYYTKYYISCTNCGSKFEVVDDIGYHHPTYRWEKLK